MKQPLTSQNVVPQLFARLPAFASMRVQDESFISHESSSPYLVFGDFGRFLSQRLSAWVTGSEDEPIVKASLGFLSEMLTSPDPEVVNLAQVSVLEKLAEKPETLEIAEAYFTDASRPVFEKWLKMWTEWLDKS